MDDREKHNLQTELQNLFNPTVGEDEIRSELARLERAAQTTFAPDGRTVHEYN